MRSIKRLGLGLALTALWATSAGPILAADNGTVDAQVTVATPCVLITNPGTAVLDFGTLPFSVANIPGTSQSVITYENCGEAAERIWAAGTDATGGTATWTLRGAPWAACAGTLNEYGVDLPGAALGATPTFVEQLGAGLSNSPVVALYMPCVGSDGAGQIMSFQINLTATF